MHPLIYEVLPSQEERYPVDADCYAPTGEDRGLCDQRLRNESLGLFQVAGGGVNLMWSIRDDECQNLLPQRQFITSEEVERHGIHQYWKRDKWQYLMFVVQPTFSWGHLSITEDAFRKILASLRIFTPFLQVVHTFGQKTNDKQRARDLVYDRLYPSATYEFCYNIRYFELNGRGRGNPWSLRQTGVYQKCMSNERSVWLLLNYSNYLSDRVSAALAEESNLVGACAASPLVPHIFILSTAARNWDQYTENLGQKVMLFEEKAYSSRIDEKYLDDYELLFADVQKIALLGDTITVATTVIKGQRATLSRCSKLHIKLHGRNLRKCNCDMTSTLSMLKVDLQHYHEVLLGLVRTTSKTTQLLSAILATRANDSLRAIMATIQTGIAELQLQSRKTGLDTASLLKITTQGHKDGFIIKVLTQIATVFLPASLVATLFSSTIFSNSSNNISYVSLYFTITVPLLLVTILLQDRKSVV